MESDTGPQSDRPDGIEHAHARPIRGWRRHASPLAVVVFGIVLALGLTGALGHERTWTATGGGTSLTVHAPATIRNGEFFEIGIRVTPADGAIGELGVGIDRALLTDMTVNTMIPAATDEESAHGEFRLTFAQVDAGDTFVLKVDLQVNPDILGGNGGAITVYDGEERIVGTTVDIRVLP